MDRGDATLRVSEIEPRANSQCGKILRKIIISQRCVHKRHVAPERRGRTREVDSARRREKRNKRKREKERRQGGAERRRSDGVINDRVFNTLYGLAYKLRAVHRSSWQRINGRGAEHGADLPLSPSRSPVLFHSSLFVTDLYVDLLGRVIVSRFPSVAPVYSFSLSHAFHRRCANANASR